MGDNPHHKKRLVQDPQPKRLKARPLDLPSPVRPVSSLGLRRILDPAFGWDDLPLS